MLFKLSKDARKYLNGNREMYLSLPTVQWPSQINFKNTVLVHTDAYPLRHDVATQTIIKCLNAGGNAKQVCDRIAYKFPLCKRRDGFKSFAFITWKRLYMDGRKYFQLDKPNVD